MATKHQLTDPTQGITCHAWNADRSMIAMCPNNNEIHIYGGCNTATWEKLHVLPEHDLVVSGLDWSAVHNKIVSCSHDRNAFVWTFDRENNKWVPALVILRIDRAALDVKWSLDGLRFAVTSGAKCVPVCTYEASNDWWVSKMVKKKFKSTVLCCAFHPHNGQLLATGSSDFKCRVYSTFDSAVDSAPSAGVFETAVEFGEAYIELTSSGWVTAVAWSPSGNTLCYSGHDSSIHMVTFSGGGASAHQTIRFRDLPLTSLLFVSEKAVIGGGHDFNPMVFTTSGDPSGWSFLDKLDKKKEKAKEAATGGVAAARALFQNKASRGQDSSSDGDKLWTAHEGTISDMALVSPSVVSTAALDGRVVLWNLPQLHIAMASMGL
mmetsp:Transcript_1724/g.2701  ORF Transcript_1724/g.2701 Transcript_1724/m.2701 type:complete len:378 (+) Transcript_1724:70-1203(+)|eukprot:CAMPEP_0185024448 /NCGR_PEP_ID=MMETSP1103-20130426/7527_1 /TAXON_ID=36769 /ORGANISM="Paraphysomonas bandaiensis, Strain Caron Lab Isolate" /LENGTH=377 /DNA_ID=CAMNT_0027557421 /DNA_START=69 /DNA_END=1202 /DNA_ORIENTATION=+